MASSSGLVKVFGLPVEQVVREDLCKPQNSLQRLMKRSPASDSREHRSKAAKANTDVQPESSLVSSPAASEKATCFGRTREVMFSKIPNCKMDPKLSE